MLDAAGRTSQRRSQRADGLLVEHSENRVEEGTNRVYHIVYTHGLVGAWNPSSNQKQMAVPIWLA